MTERLHFHFYFSCIGEGNGNPLQCSYLENPRDGGAWWAAIYGVIQSWTRLKRLSSSSSNSPQESMVLAQKWIYRPMEQDRKPRNIHAPMGTLFLTEEVRIFNGTKSAS